ncbi:MAG: hypothetical protein NT013_31405 [Planctomycetia bacterium]|nr:hypothetical protein [Planctomycetia bacterium]
MAQPEFDPRDFGLAYSHITAQGNFFGHVEIFRETPTQMCFC